MDYQSYQRRVNRRKTRQKLKRAARDIAAVIVCGTPLVAWAFAYGHSLAN